MNGLAMGHSQFSCYQGGGGLRVTDKSAPLRRRIMRKLLATITTTAALFAVGSATNQASAMPLGDPSGIRNSLDQLNVINQVQYYFGGRQYCWYEDGWNG